MDSGKSAAARPRTWPRHWKPAPSRERWSSRKARSRPWPGSAWTPAPRQASRIAAVTGGLPARCGEVAGTEQRQRPVAGTVRVPGGGTGRSPRLPGRGPASAPSRQPWATPRARWWTSPPTAPRSSSPARGPGRCWRRAAPWTCTPRSFTPGTALATEVGNIPVVLLKTGEDSFRLFPRASFADFLGRWLLDAMREFASPEVP